MDRKSTEWWLWRFYRAAALWIHQPNPNNEEKIHSIIEEYRNFHFAKAQLSGDPHEHSMDYT